MGGEAYWYFEKYDSDVNAVLQALREREYKAGRYNPVMEYLDFPLGPTPPAPGAQHASIDEAREAAAEDGTRSILDMEQVADTPDLCAVAPLGDDALKGFYGTARPTRQMVEGNMDFFEDLERGVGVYIILYKDGKPDGLFFAGISFD